MQMNSSEINNFFIVTSIIRPVALVEALVAVVGHQSVVTAITVSAITVPRWAGRFNQLLNVYGSDGTSEFRAVSDCSYWRELETNNSGKMDLVEPSGIEPLTSTLRTWRSPN